MCATKILRTGINLLPFLFALAISLSLSNTSSASCGSESGFFSSKNSSDSASVLAGLHILDFVRSSGSPIDGYYEFNLLDNSKSLRFIGMNTIYPSNVKPNVDLKKVYAYFNEARSPTHGDDTLETYINFLRGNRQELEPQERLLLLSLLGQWLGDTKAPNLQKVAAALGFNDVQYKKPLLFYKVTGSNNWLVQKGSAIFHTNKDQQEAAEQVAREILFTKQVNVFYVPDSIGEVSRILAGKAKIDAGSRLEGIDVINDHTTSAFSSDAGCVSLTKFYNGNEIEKICSGTNGLVSGILPAWGSTIPASAWNNSSKISLPPAPMPDGIVDFDPDNHKIVLTQDTGSVTTFTLSSGISTPNPNKNDIQASGSVSLSTKLNNNIKINAELERQMQTASGSNLTKLDILINKDGGPLLLSYQGHLYSYDGHVDSNGVTRIAQELRATLHSGHEQEVKVYVYGQMVNTNTNGAQGVGTGITFDLNKKGSLSASAEVKKDIGVMSEDTVSEFGFSNNTSSLYVAKVQVKYIF